MKDFYALSLIAAVAVTACAAQGLGELCVPVPECPLENHKNYTVHVADPSDCHKFYKCDRGCGYLFDCPLAEIKPSVRLVFNPILQVCDWPGNVPAGTCSGTTPPSPTPSSSTPPSPTPSSSTTPSPTPSSSTTPSPTPSSSTPPSPTPSSSTPSSSTPPWGNRNCNIPKECPKRGNTYIAHESDCRRYYSCQNGVKSRISSSCLNGHIFNAIISACDEIANTECCVTGFY